MDRLLDGAPWPRQRAATSRQAAVFTATTAVGQGKGARPLAEHLFPGWFDRELAEALRMPEADQAEFELTLPTEALANTLKRAREDARAGYADGLKRTPTKTDEERRARFRLAEQTCDELLARLGNKEEAQA